MLLLLLLALLIVQFTLVESSKLICLSLPGIAPKHLFLPSVEEFNASAPASAGGTDRDLAWTQLAQKLGIKNIIEFKHYKFKIIYVL
jgi:hypothetical protein